MQQEIPEHTLLGRKGEDYAAQLLSKKGYKIEDRNWRLGHFEVDIIASNRKEIVFVEVKTRSTRYGDKAPEEYVDADKCFRMKVACNAYMKKNHIEKEPRFDIIGILMDKDSLEIVDVSYMENAFAPSFRTVGAHSFSGLRKKFWK